MHEKGQRYVLMGKDEDESVAQPLTYIRLAYMIWEDAGSARTLYTAGKLGGRCWLARDLGALAWLHI